MIENQEKVEYPFLGILFYLDRRIGGEVGLFFLFQEVEERGSKSVFLAERFPVFGGGEIFGILAGIADDVSQVLNVGRPGQGGQFLRLHGAEGFFDGIDVAGVEGVVQ